MENLSQYAQIGIVAGAFLIGCLLTWLIGRSARRQMEAGYAGRLQSAQAALKRREDDLETVREQLAAQRERAEQLAAERAAFQSKWEQAQSEAAARIEELELALTQEREERVHAHAEPARVSEVTLEAEPDEPEDDAADTSPPEAEAESPAAEPQPEPVEDTPAEQSEDAAAEQTASPGAPPARETGKLAEARSKIASLSESVSALSAIAAQLAAALEQRNRELAALRSRREPSGQPDEAEDDRSQLLAQLHARDTEVDALNKLLGQAQDEAYKLADEKIDLETQLQAREAEFSALNILLGQVHSESDKLADAKADLEALLQARDAEILALNEDLEQALAEAMQSAAERTPPAQASESGAAPDVAGQPPSKAVALNAAWTLGVEPGELAQPQDLNEVTGIGAIFEQRLFAAGVGTYWELANLSDAEMRRILQVDDVRHLRARPDEIRAEAYRLAQETDTVGRVWAGRLDDYFTPDDDETGDKGGDDGCSDDDAQDDDAGERRA